jgi:hypothetical protein
MVPDQSYLLILKLIKKDLLKATNVCNVTNKISQQNLSKLTWESPSRIKCIWVFVATQCNEVCPCMFSLKNTENPSMSANGFEKGNLNMISRNLKQKTKDPPKIKNTSLQILLTRNLSQLALVTPPIIQTSLLWHPNLHPTSVQENK